jgi:hypothetical protein
MPIRPVSWLQALIGSAALCCLVGCGGDGTPKSVTKTRVQERQEGTLSSVAGEEGEMGFGAVFVSPPKLDVNVIGENGNEPTKHTVIVEVQADKFKWKNTAKKGDAAGSERIRWKAIGQVEK